jgi:hypothetical protein
MISVATVREISRTVQYGNSRTSRTVHSRTKNFPYILVPSISGPKISRTVHFRTQNFPYRPFPDPKFPVPSIPGPKISRTANSRTIPYRPFPNKISRGNTNNDITECACSVAKLLRIIDDKNFGIVFVFRFQFDFPFGARRPMVSSSFLSVPFRLFFRQTSSRLLLVRPGTRKTFFGILNQIQIISITLITNSAHNTTSGADFLRATPLP